MGFWQKGIDTRALEIAAAVQNQQHAHEDGCERRWQVNEQKLDKVHEKIDKQDQKREKFFADNQKQLDRIKQLLYIGFGIALAIGALNTELGQRVGKLLTAESNTSHVSTKP